MLRPPARLTRAPDAPPGLLGVASLRGTATPVFDLGRVLGGENAPGARRLVLVEHLGPVGLVVEAVEGLESGVVAAGDALDLDRLLPRPVALAAARLGERVRAQAPAASEATALASFRVGARLYAVPLSRLLDAVALDLAAPEGQAIGDALAWRGRQLPLVSASNRLHGGPAALPHTAAAARALVIERPEGLTALAVEATGEVLRLRLDTLQPAPAALRGGAASHVFPVAGDARLAALLDLDRLLDGAPAAAAAELPVAAEPDQDRTEQVVAFGIGGRRFAAPAAAVEAVTPRLQRLTRAPGAPGAVRGLLNRHGRTIPVLGLAGGRWTLLLTLGQASLGLDVTEPPRTLRGARVGHLLTSDVFDHTVRLEDGDLAPVLACAAPATLAALAQALQPGGA